MNSNLHSPRIAGANNGSSSSRSLPPDCYARCAVFLRARAHTRRASPSQQPLTKLQCFEGSSLDMFLSCIVSKCVCLCIRAIEWTFNWYSSRMRDVVSRQIRDTIPYASLMMLQFSRSVGRSLPAAAICLARSAAFAHHKMAKRITHITASVLLPPSIHSHFSHECGFMASN